eukprot:6705005-Prymnesium_polylepis.1
MLPETPYICSSPISYISSDQVSSPTAAIPTVWPSKQLDDGPGLGLAASLTGRLRSGSASCDELRHLGRVPWPGTLCRLPWGRRAARAPRLPGAGWHQPSQGGLLTIWAEFSYGANSVELHDISLTR